MNIKAEIKDNKLVITTAFQGNARVKKVTLYNSNKGKCYEREIQEDNYNDRGIQIDADDANVYYHTHHESNPDVVKVDFSTDIVVVELNIQYKVEYSATHECQDTP